MNVECKNIKITSTGGNADIISTICDTFAEERNKYSDFCFNLKALDFRDQCWSVFWYVCENIRYQADQGRDQLIKTPARLMYDRVGDCKSMALFCACCLWSLGVHEIRFRFVSFTDCDIYSHVYVVANHFGETIILDPVERTADNYCVFNYARPYVKCKDIIYRQDEYRTI